MAKKSSGAWPQVVRVGNVTTKIYRMASENAASGWVYVVAWRSAGGRQRKKFADPAQAAAEARLVAGQLNAGRLEATGLTVSDRDELRAAREIAGKVGLLPALREWLRVRDLTQGHAIMAAEAWAARNSTNFKPIGVGAAIDGFIKAKVKAGKQGERTYRSKLDPLRDHFGEEAPLHTITQQALEVYLGKRTDGVTRNDYRKRAVALWRWARKANHLPREGALEIEQTERAHEDLPEIGLIDAATFRRLLVFIREQHPQHLAAVVLAGFCGIRADEIHGKRADRSIRQTWEDILLDHEPPFVRVTVAKKNTPAHRMAPLCPAAVEWLMLCPGEHKGPVCEAAALEKVRALARRAGFTLPENCLRHSYISHRIPVVGSKAKVALEAGNSETQIDRHYRRPLTQREGEAWFGVWPRDSAEVIPVEAVS